jgi:predicted enzyme related to lactoylglutathione lyase
MAKKRMKKVGGRQTKAKTRTKARKPPAPRPATSRKATSKRARTGAKGRSATSTKPSKRKAASRPAKSAAAAHDGVFRKMLQRVKPLFAKPIDPRIRHMVEAFGEEAVKGLIAAYRKSRDTADAELADALARAEAMKPPPVHGSWAWHELMTHDVSGARRFYSGLFGWEPYDIEMMPGFTYTVFRHEGKDAGGMMQIRPEQGDMPPGWSVYVTVDDVDAAADRAETLGGEVLVPPHDIPVGRWALIKDPTGATICLWKAKM